jgi:hypothetical protein
MDGSDVGRHLVVEVLQKSNELFLSLALIGLTPDKTRAGIESRKQVECPLTFILMLYSYRKERPQLSGSSQATLTRYRAT